MAGAAEAGDLLRKWGLPADVVKKFTDEQFTKESILLLSEEAISELIPKAGPRYIFLHQLNNLKQNIPSVDDANSSDAVDCDAHSEDRPPPPKKSCDLLNGPPVNILHQQLQQSIDGKIILSYYQTNNELGHSQRDALAERIILNETSKNFNRRISREEFKALAEKIVELFPTESLETWFDIASKKKRTFIEERRRFFNAEISEFSLRSRITKITSAFRSKASVSASKNAIPTDNDRDQAPGKRQGKVVLSMLHNRRRP